MEKNIYIGLTIIGAIAVLLIAYQHLVALPKAQIAAERAEAALERENAAREELRREERFLACNQDAYTNYSANWDGQCELNGLEADCALPRYQADGFDEGLETDKDRCVTLYGG